VEAANRVGVHASNEQTNMSLMRWLARKGNVGGTARWAALLYQIVLRSYPGIDAVSAYKLMIHHRMRILPNKEQELMLVDLAENMRGLRGLVVSVLSVEAGFLDNTPQDQQIFLEIIEEELFKAGLPEEIVFGREAVTRPNRPTHNPPAREIVAGTHTDVNPQAIPANIHISESDLTNCQIAKCQSPGLITISARHFCLDHYHKGLTNGENISEDVRQKIARAYSDGLTKIHWDYTNGPGCEKNNKSEIQRPTVVLNAESVLDTKKIQVTGPPNTLLIPAGSNTPPASQPVISPQAKDQPRAEFIAATENLGAPRILPENELYALVWKELAIKKGDKGAWAQAYAECDGDKERTRATYIRLRVAQLQQKQQQRLKNYKEQLKAKNVLSTKLTELSKKYPKESDRRIEIKQRGYDHYSIDKGFLDDRTLLMRAAKNGDEDAVILLLLLGASSDCTIRGQTAVSLARDNNREDIAMLIETFHLLGTDAGNLELELMKEWGVTFDGNKYIVQGCKYDNLDDAINYARLQRTKPKNSDDPPTEEKPAEAEPKEPPQQPPGKGFWGRLINGDFGLAKTYWVYGVLAGIIIDVFSRVITSITALVLLFLASTTYSVPVLIGTWRAASKYAGLRLWAILAKASTMFGSIALALTLVALLGLVQTTGSFNFESATQKQTTTERSGPDVGRKAERLDARESNSQLAQWDQIQEEMLLRSVPDAYEIGPTKEFAEFLKTQSLAVQELIQGWGQERTPVGRKNAGTAIAVFQAFKEVKAAGRARKQQASVTSSRQRDYYSEDLSDKLPTRECEYKPVMRDKDYIACGIEPHNPAENAKPKQAQPNTEAAQIALKRLGYLQSEPTGRLDSYTIIAIRAFQKDRRIPETGEIDFNTLRALRIQP